MPFKLAVPEKILIIMLRRLGDVVLTTPAVRALKRLFPRAAIHFLAEPAGAEALQGDPALERVWSYAPERGEGAAAAYLRWLKLVRGQRYDWVIDYMGNPRSAMLAFASGARLRAGPAHVWHRWAYNQPLAQSSAPCYAGLEKIRVLRSLGLTADESDILPSLRVGDEPRRRAAEAIARLWPAASIAPASAGTAGLRPARPAASGPLVGLVPASRKETRRWPARRFGALGRRLAQEADCRLLVFWGPGERALAEEVALEAGGAARTAPEAPTIKDLAGLLAACRLVVTNCNGPKHIAVACGVPTVTVHGSSDPACWSPPHPAHVVVRRDELACIGCRKNACPTALECLEGLAPERVAQAALALLRARREAVR